MNPALITALVSAVVVLLGAGGWLLRLRAAMVDVFDEIRANANGLKQLEQTPSLPRSSLFSFEARKRSGELLRQGCSRATCSAVADAYSHVGALCNGDANADASAITPGQITAAREASKRALGRLDRSFGWQKWRRAPSDDVVHSEFEGSRSRRVPPPMLWLAALVVLPALVFAAVSLSASDDPDQRGDGAPARTPLDPSIIKNARGTVTVCTGSDASDALNDAVKDFNSKFGADGLGARITYFPEQADQQYEEFRTLQLARSGACDVLYSDVIWTADFALRGWLHDLSRYIKDREEEFVPAMLETVTFDNRKWGVPKQADAGLLFYRKDRVVDPPTTWQALYRQAKPDKRLRYQARAYEGLTVNFLELAYAAGAQNIVSADGRDAKINQPAALDALRFMVDGIRDGVAPREVVNHKEAQSRRAFLRGRANFMRNWPSDYAQIRESEIADDVGVTSLPSWKGGIQANVLGGHNLVISTFSKNPAAALKLIDYLTGPEIIRQDAIDHAHAPVLLDLWDDSAVQRALPVSSELDDAIRNARVRPVAPNYQDVSRAIYTNVNRALQGEVTPDKALQAANDQMQQALNAAYCGSADS